MNEKPSETLSPDAQDEILFQILDDYVSRFPDGNFPDLPTVRREHPEMADQVWKCLEGLAIMQGSSRVDAGTLRETPEKMAFPEPLGDFQLLREIGRGGMGVVYEARQCSLGRRVALKTLPFAATIDPRQLQRFHNEASAAAHLEHPGIVPIYAVGSQRGVHYYAMKFIDGQHLGVLIKDLRQKSGIPEPAEDFSGSRRQKSRGWSAAQSADRVEPCYSLPSDPEIALRSIPGSLESTLREFSQTAHVSRLFSENRHSFYRTAAQYMLQAAEALDYAHQCGVIHRDIKPANLLVDTHGKLWITDFGLAHIQSNVQLTQTGEIFGTPRYMSPEQAQGKNRLVDHRADIYSLGATFYEMLTLRPIFPEKNQLRLLQRISHEEPVSPRRHDPRIPRELETILLKCIAKTPRERYETAEELAADLRRFLEDRPIRAKRPGIMEITRKWLRRHPSVVGTAVAMLAVFVGALLMNRHALVSSQRQTQDALDEAHARFSQARQAADTLISIAKEDLGDTHSPAMRQIRHKLLYTALGLYRDFLTNDELDAETQAQITAAGDYVQQFIESITELEGMPPIYLLNMPEVQRDLNLMPPQREKISKLAEAMRRTGEELFLRTRSMTYDQRLAVMVRNIREEVAQAEEILTSEQFRRLIQIGLQVRPDALSDPQVIRQLNLTEAQQKKILEIQILNMAQQNMPPMLPPAVEPPRHGPPPGRGGGPPTSGNRPREANSFSPWRGGRSEPPGPPPGDAPPPVFMKNDANQKEKEAVLTEEQMELWKEMRGAPFQTFFIVPQGREAHNRGWSEAQPADGR